MFNIDNMIYAVISIVVGIREELATQYDIITEDYKGYRGLCDMAYVMFKEDIIAFNIKHKTNFEVVNFHGEQKHTARIDPRNWCYQHTWGGIREHGSKKILYVDATSQQFQWLYDDIPDYYISFTPPRWYMSDRKNFFFIVYRINKWAAIKIFEKLDYYVWGNLCRIYRKILK